MGLSAEQIAAYERDGYVSPIDVMSPDQAGSLREQFERAERDHPLDLHAEHRNNAHLAFPFLADLALDETIVSCVQSLLGDDVLLWGTVLFIKEAGSAGYVSWHQDARYMGLEPHDFLTPWLAITSSTLANGCLSVIPGSHHQSLRPHVDTFADDNILTRGQQTEVVDESIAVHLELQPGQMSIHHPRLIHGSQPNPSTDRRIGFALQSFVAPHVKQTLGPDFAMPISGHDQHGNFQHVPPPVEVAGEAERGTRQRVNDNYADILYSGAERRRAL